MKENEIRNYKKSYHLKNLYLDPNNYRFVDNNNYIKIEESQITNERIQKRTRAFIEGKNRENIRDLILSFKANGFLEVDVIQVRELGSNQFLVIEGNRRITALKNLQEEYEQGMDIGVLNPNIFKSIPFEIHANEAREKHLVIMGLKHISGNKKWAPINQAQLIYDYLSPYWQDDNYYLEEENLCNSLGITKVKMRTSQRAYHLILEYKESDYGDQFESDMYSLFVEIIKRPSIKDWIEWEDNTYSCKNKNNMNRLFSWLSKTEDFNNENIEEEVFEEIDPIITKTPEIRDLSHFINNEEAIKVMEESKSISRGLIESGTIEKKNYEKSLIHLNENVSNLSRYRDLIDMDDMNKLKEIKDNLLSILPKQVTLDIVTGNYSTCFEFGEVKHFSEVFISKYKVFNDFKIDRLNRINIFAGFNNSGKTSLLEAVYLLTKQNDIGKFLDLLKYKNKISSLNPKWLNTIFSDEIKISGIFNGINTEVNIEKYEARDIDKKDDYITSYKINSKLADRHLDNTIHTFEYDTIKRKNEKVEHLCNSILKSPYYYNFNEILLTYNSSIENKVNGNTALEIVMDFIKKFDETIVDIKLTEVDDIKRFIVISKQNIDINFDITNYGEGIQRIFEIALTFAYSKNGVVCIDEFETAIHKSLLIDFTKFIQTLSETFNVQVFLSTHSKECIDAFVKNKYNNDTISAYLFREDENKISLKHINGNRLEYLVENINLDIRGDGNE